MNEYLVGQLIQDGKTLTSQLEYYTKYMIKTGKKLESQVLTDVAKTLVETATAIELEIAQ